MAKKTLWDGSKIMMIMARNAKKKGRQLYIQVVSHEIYKEIVYICDGCCIFPIEKTVYDANVVKYGFDKAGINQDLYKLMRDAYDAGSDAKITPITFDNSGSLTTRIVRYNKGYAMLDTIYTDLINFLPSVLCDNTIHGKDDKSPFTGYKESCDLGYCILPIYNRKGAYGSSFEDIIKDLACVCD